MTSVAIKQLFANSREKLVRHFVKLVVLRQSFWSKDHVTYGDSGRVVTIMQ